MRSVCVLAILWALAGLLPSVPAVAVVRAADPAMSFAHRVQGGPLAGVQGGGPPARRRLTVEDHGKKPVSERGVVWHAPPHHCAACGHEP